MLAELFNAVVSRLFETEYKNLAEFYLQAYRRVGEENVRLAQELSVSKETTKKYGTALKQRERELETAQTELQTAQKTIKTTTIDKCEHESQKQLICAAMINMGAKDTISQLRGQVEGWEARDRQNIMLMKQTQKLLDIVTAERDALLKTNKQLETDLIALETECRRLGNGY